jgi:hypothetical protein
LFIASSIESRPLASLLVYHAPLITPAAFRFRKVDPISAATNPNESDRPGIVTSERE